MIVAVIGTHGAGKSTLVARVVKRFDIVRPLNAEFTTRPAIMACRSEGVTNLAVVGDYLSVPYSGVDSGRFSGHIDWIFKGAVEHDCAGWNILMEGMLLIGAWRRLEALQYKGHQVSVLCLNPGLDVCVAGLKARKAARNNKSSKLAVNRALVIKKGEDALAAGARLKQCGVGFDVYTDRAAAEDGLRRLLGAR